MLVTDQLTKTWVRSYSEGFTIFRTGLFQFVHSRNTGAIFGMFQDYSVLLTVITSFVVTAILVMVLFFWWRIYIFDSVLTRTSLGLYFGGAIGNLADRMRFGSVTDFIDFRVWPSFNVADASMTVGVIMFAYALIFVVKPEK